MQVTTYVNTPLGLLCPNNDYDDEVFKEYMTFENQKITITPKPESSITKTDALSKKRDTKAKQVVKDNAVINVNLEELFK